MAKKNDPFSGDSLEAVIRRWIRAEYMARLGAGADCKQWQEAEVTLEEQIREMVTGHKDFWDSAKSLGLKRAKIDRKKASKTGKHKPSQLELF